MSASHIGGLHRPVQTLVDTFIPFSHPSRGKRNASESLRLLQICNQSPPKPAPMRICGLSDPAKRWIQIMSAQASVSTVRDCFPEKIIFSFFRCLKSK